MAKLFVCNVIKQQILIARNLSLMKKKCHRDKELTHSQNSKVDTKPQLNVTFDLKHPMFYGHHQPGVHWDVDIGLDISTSIVGVCFLDHQTGKKITLFHIDLTSKKFENMWQKVDHVMEVLVDKVRWYKSSSNAGPPPCFFKRVFVEANAKGYKTGFSSADTLFTLAKMNGIISYECYKQLKLPVIDVNVTSARSRIGYKDKKAIKRPVKEKVREFVLQVYPEIAIETRIVERGKHKGERVPVEGAADEIDAFVICRGGQLLNP